MNCLALFCTTAVVRCVTVCRFLSQKWMNENLHDLRVWQQCCWRLKSLILNCAIWCVNPNIFKDRSAFYLGSRTLCVLLDPESEGSIILCNVRDHSSSGTMSHPGQLIWISCAESSVRVCVCKPCVWNMQTLLCYMTWLQSKWTGNKWAVYFGVFERMPCW